MKALAQLTLSGALAGFALTSPAVATAILPITSDNSLGVVEWTNSVGLNTDNGRLCGFSNTGVCVDQMALPTTVVVQADGSAVRVFNFNSLTIDFGIGVLIYGSAPAAIAASGNITINGVVTVANPSSRQIFADGNHPADTPGSGPLGGATGTGVGRYVGSPVCCGYDTSSGGGGGGKASAGGDGEAGHLFLGGQNGFGGLGGSADAHPAILSGGGAGASGTHGFGYDFYSNPGKGGDGGGAVVFVTPGDLTIGSHGVISADGQSGGITNLGTAGAGGGGAGGAIWFEVGGVWRNSGAISAQGASGGRSSVAFGAPGDGGNGAGGQIVIDPTAIYNYGTINVGDGNGTAVNGGHVALIAPTIVNQGSIVGVAPGVPEPNAWAMLVAGFGIVGAAARRRRPAARAA